MRVLHTTNKTALPISNQKVIDLLFSVQLHAQQQQTAVNAQIESTFFITMNCTFYIFTYLC